MTWQYVVLILGIWWGLIVLLVVTTLTPKDEKPYDRGNPGI